MQQGHDQPPTRPEARRCRDDRGTAAVEFAFMVPLLALFLFGIIHFGLVLSFKQDVTRAAAEGARGGAVAFPATEALPRAIAATEQAVRGFDQDCNTGTGMECFINIHPCLEDVPSRIPNGTYAPIDPTVPRDCVTVELIYDYANHPLLAELPLLSGFLPDTIQARNVARTNETP